MLSRFLTAVLLVTAASPLSAQTTVRFINVAPKESTEKYELVAKNIHSDPFALPSNFLSPKMKASGRDLSLVQVDKADDAPPLEFSLPRSGRDFVVVVSKKDEALDAYVLRADDRSFKPGEVFVHNSSSHPVRGVIGDTEFKLEPFTATTVRPKVGRKDTSIEVSFFYTKDDKEQTLSTTKWPVEENTRSYLFFFTNDRELPDYRAVDEFVNPDN